MSAIRRPLPKTGPKKERWGRWQQQNYLALARRCRGKCEGCGAVGARLDPHHVAGRGNNLSEPWASWHPLLAALCRSCHSTAHLGEAALDVYRWAAVGRMREYLRIVELPEALDTLRAMVRELEDRGFDPQAQP